jgi:DNA-binding transcriptional regulator YbjK
MRVMSTSRLPSSPVAVQAGFSVSSVPSASADAAGAVAFTGRRLELVDAAVAVVARAGLRGLTHRAVDAQAGLPEGSCSTTYRTRVALLTALAQYVGGRLSGAVAELTVRLTGRGGDTAYAIEQTSELFTELLRSPEIVAVAAELSLEAIRTPELMAVVDPWRVGLVDLVEGVIAEAGRPQPRERAQAVVAALQGVLTGSLIHPPAERPEFVRLMLGIVMSGLQSEAGSAG